MIRVFPKAGTVLAGRKMMAQLAREIHLTGAGAPAVVCLPKDTRRARRAARNLAPGFPAGVPVTAGNPPLEADFLILAGGKAISDIYANDPRPRALVPLCPGHLAELDGSEGDYLVLDTAFFSLRSTVAQDFFRRYAHAVSDGSGGMPGKLDVPDSFVYSSRTRGLAGNGALAELPGLLREAGVERPLILSDQGLVAAGLVDRLKTTLEGIPFEVFDSIPPDSDTRVVDAVVAEYRKGDRDGLIAFGGGSVLDTGKGVVLGLSHAGRKLADWAGSDRIPRLNTPFFAVPTTSGTGSEVTKAAVIADADQARKVLYISANLQPGIAILDGSLTVGLPPFLTSITGMDALSHAVEAFIGMGKNPLSDQMAWGAVERIRDHLIPLMDEPGDVRRRGEMAVASCLAGAAFSNSMVSMVHTIGHSVGSVCHAPHGACMAVLLPHALEFNRPVIARLLARLLPALVGTDAAGEYQSDEESSLRFIARIREMNGILRNKTQERHPEKLRHILDSDGAPLVQERDFETIARTALGDGSIVYNPREIRFRDILNTLENAY